MQLATCSLYLRVTTIVNVLVYGSFWGELVYPYIDWLAWFIFSFFATLLSYITTPKQNVKYNSAKNKIKFGTVGTTFVFVLYRLGSVRMGKQFNGSVWPRTLQHSHYKTFQGCWFGWSGCSSNCGRNVSQFGMDCLAIRKVQCLLKFEIMNFSMGTCGCCLCWQFSIESFVFLMKWLHIKNCFAW